MFQQCKHFALFRRSQSLLSPRAHSTLPYSFQRALIPHTAIGHEAVASIPLTKIVATIGPASEQLPMLSKVFDAGLNVMRINFSHATYEEADLRTTNLNACRENDCHLTKPIDNWMVNTRSIMLDTQGPEIRTGSFDNGIKEVDLVAGNEVIVTPDSAFQKKQTANKIWISYSQLTHTAKPGNIFLLDDGAIQLQVISQIGNDLKCKILNNGSLGNKKGVNMPGLQVQLPAISDKDKQDLIWGIKNNVDCIAASFIRKPSDVHEIRQFCQETIHQLGYKDHERSIPLIISKIESTEGLENFSEILKVSDAIMVARGDLAVEIPMETLTAVQKEIVKQCNQQGKPVIVATQMLESMQKSPRPTRAEITDVANAILDGADCVMLSGESAKGKYPVESVFMMKRIIQETELNVQHHSLSLIQQQHPFLQHLPNTAQGKLASSIAERIFNSKGGIHGIVLQFSNESFTMELSKLLSKCKLFVPIFFPVSSYKHARLLTFYQSLYPMVTTTTMTTNGTDTNLLPQIHERFGKDCFQSSSSVAGSDQRKQFLTIRYDGHEITTMDKLIFEMS